MRTLMPAPCFSCWPWVHQPGCTGSGEQQRAGRAHVQTDLDPAFHTNLAHAVGQLGSSNPSLSSRAVMDVRSDVMVASKALLN